MKWLYLETDFTFKVPLVYSSTWIYKITKAYFQNF